MFKVQNGLGSSVDAAIFRRSEHTSVVAFGAALGWTRTERHCVRSTAMRLRPLRTIPTVSALWGITHCRVFVSYPADFVCHTVAFCEIWFVKMHLSLSSMLFFNLVWWRRFLINCVLKLETKIQQERHTSVAQKNKQTFFIHHWKVHQWIHFF